MSTVELAAAQGAGTTRPQLKVTQTRVIRSEWIKFRSLRSTVWTLLVAMVLMIGFSALFAAVTASQYDGFSASELADFKPVSTSLGGVTFAQLAIGVLGAMLITSEYSTGMIRSSLTAVPRRLPVLWGKLAVFSGVVAAVSLVTSFVSFFLGQSLLSSAGVDVSISSPDALRSVIGAALYMTVAGAIGMSLGALLRNTAAGITTFVAAFFVVPLLSNALPSSISDNVAPYLPSNAGAALYGGAMRVSNSLSPWTGFAVMCAYAVVALSAAAWRLRRRDV